MRDPAYRRMRRALIGEINPIEWILTDEFVLSQCQRCDLGVGRWHCYNLPKGRA